MIAVELGDLLQRRIYEANAAIRRLFPDGIRLVLVQSGDGGEVYEAQASLNPFGLLMEGADVAAPSPTHRGAGAECPTNCTGVLYSKLWRPSP